MRRIADSPPELSAQRASTTTTLDFAIEATRTRCSITTRLLYASLTSQLSFRRPSVLGDWLRRLSSPLFPPAFFPPLSNILCILTRLCCLLTMSDGESLQDVLYTNRAFFAAQTIDTFAFGE
jgi:hypothetical protein